MAQTPCTYRQEGDVIDYTPVSAVLAGSVYVLGNIITIVPHDIAAGQKGVTALRGVFNVPKDASNVTAGDKLYWDIDGSPVGGTALSGAFTKTEQGLDGTANKLAGVAIEDAGTGVGDVDMFLRSVYGT